MAAAKPSLGRVLPGSTILFLCDLQEKFRHVAYFPQIVSVAARMLQVRSPLLQARGPGPSLGLRPLPPFWHRWPGCWRCQPC